MIATTTPSKCLCGVLAALCLMSGGGAAHARQPPDSDRENDARELELQWRYPSAQRDAETARKRYEELAIEEWKAIRSRLTQQQENRERLWRDCESFAARFPDTKTAREAQDAARDLLANSPSPWSKLKLLAAPDWMGPLPKEVAAVIDIRRSPQINYPTLTPRVSRDGKYVAVLRRWQARDPATQRVRRESEITVWDLLGQQPKEFARWTTGPKGCADATFDRSAKRLAVANWFEIESYDPFRDAQGPTDHVFLHRDIPQISVLNDTAELAAYEIDTGIAIWDLKSNRARAAITPERTSSIYAFQFAPTRSLVAVRSEDFDPDAPNKRLPAIAVWDVATTSPTRLTTPEEGKLTVPPSLPVLFSPDGRMIACANYAEGIRFWDWASKTPLAKVSPHFVPALKSMAFSPDATSFATGTTQAVALWDVGSRKKIREWGMPSPVHATEFAPDGRYLLASLDVGAVVIIRLAE